MLFFNLAPEFFSVDARPALVQSPVHPVVEMNLPVINLPGGDLHVNVRVVSVAVDRGDSSRLREVFFKMRVHHFAGFFIRHFAVKRVDRPVVRALLSPAAVVRLFQLVLFELARVFA